MTRPNFIVMLTHNDVTAPNSKEIFLGAKDAPAEYWGFKNVGLPFEEMKDLVDCMKQAGKTVFLESLAHTEQESLAGMQTAIDCGFDYLLGGHYYDSVMQLASENNIRWLPFVGKREQGKLYGEIEEIVADAQRVAKKDVFGINVSGYRYVGDAEKLIATLARSIEKPLNCVGSINSFARLDSIKSTGVWGFTIGGAFFENVFGETFAEQIAVVNDYINR